MFPFGASQGLFGGWEGLNWSKKHQDSWRQPLSSRAGLEKPQLRRILDFLGTSRAPPKLERQERHFSLVWAAAGVGFFNIDWSFFLLLLMDHPNLG